MQHHVRRELWTSKVPLYSMKPSLRNLFMNILRATSWSRPRHKRLLANLRNKHARAYSPCRSSPSGRRTPLARRFSLELKSWSSPLFLNSGVPGQQVHEHLGELGSSWSTRTMAAFSSRMMTHSVTVTTVATRRDVRSGERNSRRRSPRSRGARRPPPCPALRRRRP